MHNQEHEHDAVSDSSALPSDSHKQQIGSLIRDRRDYVGLSQQQLASRIGTSDRAVRAWEKGQSLPRGAALARVEAVLQIRIVRRGDTYVALPAPPNPDGLEAYETTGPEGVVVLYAPPEYREDFDDDEWERMKARARHALLEEGAKVKRERAGTAP